MTAFQTVRSSTGNRTDLWYLFLLVRLVLVTSIIRMSMFKAVTDTITVSLNGIGNVAARQIIVYLYCYCYVLGSIITTIHQSKYCCQHSW